MQKAYWICLFCLLSSLLQAATAQDLSNLEQGITLFSQKQWGEAAEKFNLALKEDPRNTLALTYLLDCSIRKQDMQAVVSRFEQEAVSAPDDPVFISHVGMAYFAKSLFDKEFTDESMNQFKEAIKMDPNLAMAYTGIGIIYYQKRMIPRARSFFLKALKIDERDIVAMERLGEIYLLDDKKLAEAEILFQKITKLVPLYPDGHFYLGSCLEAANKYEESATAFKRAMELDPQGVLKGYYAPVRLGDVYMKMKKYQDAIACYEKALQINPRNPYARTMLEKAKHPEVEMKSKGTPSKEGKPDV